MKIFCTFLLIISILSVLVGCINVTSPMNVVPSQAQTSNQTINQTSQVTVTTTQTIVQTKTAPTSRITDTPVNSQTNTIATSTQDTTQNPSIVITINRVGVIHDHDPLIKGAGDIYLYIGVTDGNGEPRITRIPSTGTLSLKDNESKDVSTSVFFANSPGTEFKLVALAFESDNPVAGAAGKLAIEGLSLYLTYKYGRAGLLVGDLIKSQVSQSEEGPPMELAESPSDDYVGAIERSFSVSNKSGAGTYQDIVGGDLKLSFTVSLVNQ